MKHKIEKKSNKIVKNIVKYLVYRRLAAGGGQ